MRAVTRLVAAGLLVCLCVFMPGPIAIAWHQPPSYSPPCPNGGGAYGKNWRDVDRDDWHYEYIRQVSANSVGWLSGWDYGWRRYFGYREYFYPNNDMPTYEWRGGINRAFGLSMSCGSGLITRAYAASNLIRAVGLGWVADGMTWAEATAILRRFPDYRQTPSAVYRDVATAVKYGLIQGVGTRYGARLEPNSNLTRAQGATLLARAGLARAYTDRTTYGLRDTVRAWGEYRGLDGADYEVVRLHRDDGRQLRVWYRTRSVNFPASDLGPGRYYVVYEVTSQRRECVSACWTSRPRYRTFTNTWTSAPRVFEIVNRAPAVALLAPSGEQAERQPPIRLRAEDADGDVIRRLDLQVATDSGFRSLAWSGTFNVALASGAEWSTRPAPLPEGRTLYVRARANDGAAWGPWSGSLSFLIRSAVPPAARWLEPPDGARVFYEGSLEGAFEGVPQAGVRLAEYELQAAADAGFARRVIDRRATWPGGRVARVTLTGLPDGDVWFRVRVRDERGLWSGWTTVRVTLVAPAAPGAIPPPASPGDGTGVGDPEEGAPPETPAYLLTQLTARCEV